MRAAHAGEQASVLPRADGARLSTILHRPAGPGRKRGVVIIVGGPQYRVGSHRQFVLLARHLAASGVSVLRFDYQGMGDSEGRLEGFEAIAEDVRMAVDALLQEVSDTREVVLWGLCDAASAALQYAWSDPRVRGLVLANPWVHTEQGEARTYLRHYYAKRLGSAELWGKVLSGRFNPLESGRAFGRLLRRSLGGSRSTGAAPTLDGSLPLPDRMAEGLARFEGRVLFILSGEDLIAAQFKDTVAASDKWERLMDRDTVTVRELSEANHTFSSRAWRDQVAAWTTEWLHTW